MSLVVSHRDPEASSLANWFFGPFFNQSPELYRLVKNHNFETALALLQRTDVDQIYRDGWSKKVIHLTLKYNNSSDQEMAKQFLIAFVRVGIDGGYTEEIRDSNLFSVAIKNNNLPLFTSLVQNHSSLFTNDKLQACMRAIIARDAGQACRTLANRIESENWRRLGCEERCGIMDAVVNNALAVFGVFAQTIDFNESNAPLLHALAKYGRNSFLRVLWQEQPTYVTSHISDNDTNGWSPLHIAAQKGYDVVVEEFLACGADPKQVCNQKEPREVAWTFCCYRSPAWRRLESAEYGFFDVAPGALSDKEISHRREQGLLRCCNEGQIDLAISLVDRYPVNPNITDVEGNNTAMIALKHSVIVGHNALLTYINLIRNDLDITHSNRDGVTIFGLAFAHRLDFLIVRILDLYPSLDLDQELVGGRTLLKTAICSHSREVISALMRPDNWVRISENQKNACLSVSLQAYLSARELIDQLAEEKARRERAHEWTNLINT